MQTIVTKQSNLDLALGTAMNSIDDEYRSRAAHEFMSSILQPHKHLRTHTHLHITHDEVKLAKFIGKMNDEILGP